MKLLIAFYLIIFPLLAFARADVFKCTDEKGNYEYKTIGKVDGCVKLGLPQIKKNAQYLSCDLEMDTRLHTPVHFDYYIDFDLDMVDFEKAFISDSTISFDRPRSDGSNVTTNISRLSGAITLRSDSIGTLATGICRKSESRKF